MLASNQIPKNASLLDVEKKSIKLSLAVELRKHGGRHIAVAKTMSYDVSSGSHWICAFHYGVQS